MRLKAPRLIVADQGDMLVICIKAILKEADFSTYPVMSATTFKELEHIAQLLSQTTSPHYDLLIFRNCPSRYHHAYLTKLHDAVALCQLPTLVIGEARQGWIIHAIQTRLSLVRGYLHVQDPLATELPVALQHVLDNKSYLSPHAQALLAEAKKTGLTRYRFTDDEITVLRMLAQGKVPSQIAYKMGIDRNRVYSIMARLRDLFGAKSNEDMLLQARDSGLC